jgi:hypothetical protein
VAETIKITSVYGIKDNGELVNIVVEGNSDEIPYILLTIWGKKQNRNIIREISSGEFNESIEQEIIKSAKCECGDQITIKAFCLANSSISDTWQGKLQCVEIEKEPAVTVAAGLEVEEVLEIVAVAAAEEAEEEKEVEEEEVRLPESLALETNAPEEEEEVAVTVAEDREAERVVEIAAAEEAEEEEEEASLQESLSLETPALEKEKEPAVTVTEGLEAKKAVEIEEVVEVKEEEEEKTSFPELLPLETPSPEKEEEPVVTVAEGLEVERVVEIAASEEAAAEEEGEVEASFPESLPLEAPAPGKVEETAVTVAEGLEVDRVVEIAAAEEAEGVREVEEAGLPESLPLKTSAPEKEEEPAVAVVEDREAEEVVEIVATEAGEEEKEAEEEEASPQESSPLETPAPEKEEEAAVTVVEDREAEEVIEIAAAEEEKEVEEEKADLPESLPLKTSAPEKEEDVKARVIEGREVKEERETVPKSFLFPTIEISTVKGFTYNGDLVDIVVEGTSTGSKRILVKIQWGNTRYYKIVIPSSSGEFKSSFEQDIGRSAQSEGGEQITVTTLFLANSAIFDSWKGKLHRVERVGEAANTVTGSDEVKEDKEGTESGHEK